MPSLNEVLSTLSGKAEISYISVNPITRVMTVPEEYKDLGVESDKDVRRLWFKFPKIVEDDIDLSALTLYINYKNAAGNLDSYLIEDMSVEEDCIKFSWLLSRNVTKSKGTVSYIVCGKKSNNGDIVAEWNTRVSNGTVSEGLETSASIETENADVIEQILLKIGSVPSDEPNKQENQVLTAKSDGTTSYEYPACMPISKKKGYTERDDDIEIEIYPEDGTQAFLTDEHGKYVFSYWVTNESGSSVKKTINGALSIGPGNIVIIQYDPYLDGSEPKAEIRVDIIGDSDLSNIYARSYVSNALDEWIDNSVSVHSIYSSGDKASANSGKAICETCSRHGFGILKDALVLNLESSRGYGEALVIEGSGIGVYSYDLHNMTAKKKTDKFIGYEPFDVMFLIRKSDNGEYTCTPSLDDAQSPPAPWYVHVMYVSDDDVAYYGNLTSQDSNGLHFRILKNLTETIDITINTDDSSVTVETKDLNQNSGDNA